jgi:hypothetical protein
MCFVVVVVVVVREREKMKFGRVRSFYSGGMRPCATVLAGNSNL